MNLSVKTFTSLLILVLVALGFFFSVVKVLKIYHEKENLSVKKQISSKPMDINEKQASVEPGTSLQGEFTFFDILGDASMRKFIGLDGNVIESKEGAPDKSTDFDSKINKSLDSQLFDFASKKMLSSVAPKLEAQKRSESLLPGFVLQVGSFQEFQRASVLRNKLTNKDYPVFIISAWVAEQGQTLHRVFVGRFPKKIDAEKTKIKIREIEKIDSVIKWQEGRAPKIFP